MRFEKYESYKDSGLEWLGEIPSEWEFKRFGDNFKVNKNKNKELLCDNLLSLSFGKIIRKDIKSHFGLLPKNFNNYQIIEAGYIILRLMDLQNDKKSLRVGLVEEKGIITSAYIGIIINHFLDSKFIYYLLYSYDILKVFYWEGGSIRQSMGFNEIRILPLIFPMIKTQTKIATYLDTQTQKIDKEIKLLEEKSLKYKELKQTLINETVLRGLDKGVKFETKRLKDILNLSTGNSIANKEDYENNDIKVHPYIATKDININTNEINYENGIYIPQNNNTFKILKKETTILCIEGGSAGKKIGFTNQNICSVNKLCAFKSKNNSINDKFIFYYIKSFLFKNQFFAEMSGLIGGVSIGLIKYFIISLPPLKDQQKIASYLDEKTQKIDSITKTIATKITLLKEFRKTLINDTVTGKIKVV